MQPRSRFTCRSAMAAIATAALLLATPAGAAEQQLAGIGALKLAGGTLDACSIGYRTYGTLAADKSNVVLVPTWLTGRSADLEGLIGAGKLIDPARWYVITVDALGDGVSCSPSNSKTQARLDFPRFTIADMVESQHRLLHGVLGISHVHAVVGMSMGGMQALQWAVSYPDFASRVVAMIATPQPTAQDLLTWTAELRSIDESVAWHGGHPADGARFNTLAAIQSQVLWTPSYRASNTARAGFAAFMQQQDSANLASFSAVDWYRQLQALLSFDLVGNGDLAALARSIKAPLLLVTSARDQMVQPGPASALARLSGARHLALDSDCGHMAPVCELPRVSAAIAGFLEASPQ